MVAAWSLLVLSAFVSVTIANPSYGRPATPPRPAPPAPSYNAPAPRAPPAPKSYAPAPRAPPAPKAYAPAPKAYAPPPMDCQMSAWDKWTDCSAQCGEGQRSRARLIIAQPSYGGAACGPTQEVETCNAGPCAVDCEMEDWSEWSLCSADCDEGLRQRIRSVRVEAAYGGKACGPLEELEACNNGPCAQDCVMGEWRQWGECSAACDEGIRSRTRSILAPALYGGAACGPEEELENCNNGPCAQDCVMEEWRQWGECSAACGEGIRSRHRSILSPALYGGAACGAQEELENCNNGPCAQDCIMEEWSEWSLCSADCGEGMKQRLRSILTPALYGGMACGPEQEFETCNNGPCAQDCVMSEWRPWGECSVPCGGGSRSRSRSAIVPALHGGAECGPKEEYEGCNDQPCAVDCVMEDWSEWSLCSAECGEGMKQRIRSIRIPAAGGGYECGPTEELDTCNNGPCPRDCVLGEFGPWSSCPSCGEASRHRTRSIIEEGAFGGETCDRSSLTETESCNLAPCYAPKPAYAPYGAPALAPPAPPAPASYARPQFAPPAPKYGRPQAAPAPAPKPILRSPPAPAYGSRPQAAPAPTLMAKVKSFFSPY